ncbi:S66 peptidase family protein [Adhaeretor mobilis]|uniref:Putative murein peptide carboxypeptidase n=1 Tax=Adhaeretor mobilis TaxID=1930276 RepID=A0A517MTQ2_9BACT|nr:LD-carboxypeptidase [Adhaeretor mobilis]QDS98253.1 putative murein peptide carboxypeptidase [Adhaeretor mobilis]
MIRYTLSFLFLFAFSLMPLQAKEAARKAELEMIWPKKLKPGDTIQIVASASEVQRSSIMLAKKRLEQRGYKVKMRDDMFSQLGYLAGSDQRRAEELMQAFQDPEVDAIFAARGGYGVMRMLNLLDYEVIRKNPKLVTGYSDITCLHMALNKKAQLVTLHSPNATWGSDDAKHLPKFAAKYFFRVVEQQQEPEQGYIIEVPDGVPQPAPIGSGKAQGQLVGGNLSLVVSLMGTPYEIDTRDAILLIEDTREAPYRIDRMLCQLQLAGKLDTLRGAVLGQFTENYDREKDQLTDDKRFSVNGVLHQYFDDLGIPVLINFPIGHHRANCTLPLGGMVEVDADAVALRVLPPETEP